MLGDPRACSWSLLGALVASNGSDRASILTLPINAIRSAAIALSGAIGDYSVSSWNDDPARTRAEILDAIDRARFILAADAAEESRARI